MITLSTCHIDFVMENHLALSGTRAPRLNLKRLPKLNYIMLSPISFRSGEHPGRASCLFGKQYSNQLLREIRLRDHANYDSARRDCHSPRRLWSEA